MTWAQRLKRVFNIDMPQGTLSWCFASIHLVEVCSHCGGSVKVIGEKEQEVPDRPLLVPPTRAPPEITTLGTLASKQMS